MLVKDLVIDEPSLKYIESYFKEQGQEMTPNNKQQALVIEGSTVLTNHHGMAPGMMVNFENKHKLFITRSTERNATNGEK